MKTSAESRSEQKNRYMRLLDSMADAYFEIDLDGRLTVFNNAFCSLVGRKRDEIDGTILSSNFPEDDFRAISQAIDQALRTREPIAQFECAVNRLNGTMAAVVVTLDCITDETGLSAGISGIARDITEQKKAQDALIESRSSYRTVVDSAPYAISINRLSDGTYLRANPAFCERTGFSMEELIGKRAVDLNIYVDPAAREQMIEHLLRDGQLEAFEMATRRKDGSINQSLLSARPITYKGERCLLFISTNVNALKEAQKAIEEREARYRMILDTAPYSIAITRNSDKAYIEVNEALCRRSGYSREEIIGRTPFDLNIYVEPADRARMIQRFREKGRVEAMEVRLRRKDGSISETVIFSNPIRYAGEDCLLTITIPNNSLKEYQRALRESEKRYRNILSNIEEGYWEIDFGGNFTFANEAEGRLHRCTPRELIGKNVERFSQPETYEAVQKILNRVLQTGVPAKIFDYEMIRQDGTTADIELSASLLKDASGEAIGYFGISRDVTEKKRVEKELEKYRHQLEEMVAERTRALEAAQAELVKNEKLAVLGQLTATVSHELRNPLNVIRSSNFYLQRKIDQRNEKIDKHFNRIEEQVAMCDNIVGELLEYTRGRFVSTEVEPLNPWIETLLTQKQETTDIAIEHDLSKGMPAIAHDREKMHRVLVNLLDNALMAVTDKDNAPNNDPTAYTPKIRVSTKVENCHAVLTVEDNGIGMDEKTLQSAFEPLFTTRARGTGIGLANVKKIVAEHNGGIMLHSEPGQGTTVTIKLPYPA